MQFKFFIIPVTDNGESQKELNSFLRNHRILEETHELIAGKNGSIWHFCIKYIDVVNPLQIKSKKNTKVKIDYKEVLDKQTFKDFSKLREFTEIYRIVPF